MQKTCQGDQEAYEQLLLDLNGFLDKFLYRFANNSADRMDLIQNILLSLHLSRASYDPKKEFRPWFFTLVHHRIVDHIRKAKDKFLGSEQLIEQQTLDSHYELLIQDLTQELDQRDLEIFKKIFVAGHTETDVANNLGISMTNLRVIIHRLKTKIFYNLRS